MLAGKRLLLFKIKHKYTKCHKISGKHKKIIQKNI